MTTWWCEYAWLGGDTVAEAVSVRVEDGVIRELRTGSPHVGNTLHGLVIPHSFQQYL